MLRDSWGEGHGFLIAMSVLESSGITNAGT